MSVTDHEFSVRADRFMEDIFEKLAEIDPDVLDVDLAMGVLTMEFADGRKCIMNRQTAAHQIWLAHGATAWHFDCADDGTWMDSKGRGELRPVLAELLSGQTGIPIDLG